MPDRRTDWSAVFAVIVSAATIGTIVWIAVSFFGCAAVKGNAAGVNAGQQVTADRVELMESAIIDLDRKLEIRAGVRQDATGGRDVTINDPWPLRIIVGGFPASFLVYLLGHRIPLIRKALDLLKGKPCGERQAARSIPTPDAVPDRWRKAGERLEQASPRRGEPRPYAPLDGVDPVTGWGPQDDQG